MASPIVRSGGEEAGDRVSWSAIFAGFFCAFALQIVFTLFGIGFGHSLIAAPFSGEETASPTAGGIYWLVTGVMSLFAGGFVAGRLSGVPLVPSAAMHGVVVWALATVSAAVLTVSTATSVVGGAASTVSQAATQVGDAVGTMLPEDIGNVIPDELPQSVQQELFGRNLTISDVRREAREIATELLDQQERERAREVAGAAAADVLRTPSDAARDIQDAVDRLIGPDRVIGEEERTELVNALQQRLDLPQGEAEAIVDRWSQQLSAAAERVSTAYEEVRAELTEAAQTTYDTMLDVDFWAAITSFIGLIAACLGAAFGRPEDFLTSGAARSSLGNAGKHEPR